MSNSSVNDFQQQALDALSKQQEAYLALVREWKSNAAAASYISTEMPPIPGFSVPGMETPSGSDFVRQQQQFYSRVVEQQQRFIASLNDVLGSGR